MKISKVSLSLSVAVLLAAAFSAMADSKSDTHSESTDLNGKKLTVDVSTTSSIDSAGTVKIEREYESTQDPRGLGNKTKAWAHTQSKTLINGERKNVEESVDNAGTARDYSAEVKVKRDTGGAGTTIIKSKESVDPKGFLNKQTAEITKEIKSDSDGSVVSSTVTKEVNGKPVAVQTIK